VQDRTITSLLSLSLVSSLLPSMSFPATMPAIISDMDFTASDAGWVGGIYFAGYACAVPVLSSITDRVGAKSVYLASSLVGVISSIAFALWADSFWTAFVFRLIGGAALGGVHMPGLKLLTELVSDRFEMRGAGIYASCYALGSAISFLFAGFIESAAGWHAVFGMAALGHILAAVCVIIVPNPPPTTYTAVVRIELLPLLRNRALMSYVLGYAGNTWEVFSIRVWFVAFLAWVLNQPGNHLDLPPLAVVAGVAAIAGVPASVFISELGLRMGREKAIVTVCGLSVATCLGLAATTGAASLLILPLLVLLQITSFADVGSLTAGAVAVSEEGRRGASLALYAFTGSLTGFIGPVVVGLTLDLFGEIDRETGWMAAFLVMALGSTVAAISVWCLKLLRS
jgi:MFS family permease